jgi:hypothetical protein
MLLGHRYYDPSTGRLLTRDPVGDGSDWYAYCANDPVAFADADGLRRYLLVGNLDGVPGGDAGARAFFGFRLDDFDLTPLPKERIIHELIHAGPDDEFWYYGHCDHAEGGMLLHDGKTSISQSDLERINRVRSKLGKARIKFAYVGACYSVAKKAYIANWLDFAGEVEGFSGRTDETFPVAPRLKFREVPDYDPGYVGGKRVKKGGKKGGSKH